MGLLLWLGSGFRYRFSFRCMVEGARGLVPCWTLKPPGTYRLSLRCVVRYRYRLRVRCVVVWLGKGTGLVLGVCLGIGVGLVLGVWLGISLVLGVWLRAREDLFHPGSWSRLARA